MSQERRLRSVARPFFALLPGLLLAAGLLRAQDPAPQSASTVVPQTVRYAGVAQNRAGETVEAAFRIYAVREGGEPLWSEVQQVTITPDGRYSVLLGAVGEAGLPQAVFAAGQARWLGVSIERAEEQPRTLLASVAYAMKAADAETLAGRAAAEFVTQEQLAATARTLASQATAIAMPDLELTGTGTIHYLPLWTDTATLGSSILYQAGTTQVGIATKTPATTLDVNGTSTLRGPVNLPPADPATAKSAVNSPMLELGASTYSSVAKAAVAQNFAWKAVATGNDTTTSSADLELLFGSGASSPAATGLAISPKGILTFAKGQTFPSPTSGPGSGTITGVTAGTALTGGGISGPVTLSVDTTKVPFLTAPNTFTGSNTFSSPITFAASQTFPAPATGPGSGTITGVSAGTALIGGGTNGPVTLSVDTTKVVTAVNSGTGLTGGGTGGAQTLSVDATKVPLLGSANTYAGSQTFSGAVTAQTLTVTGNQTVNGTENIGVPSGYTFPAKLNVVQSGTQGIALEGFSPSGGSGVWAEGDGQFGSGLSATSAGAGGIGVVISATDKGYGNSPNGTGVSATNTYYGVAAVGDCCGGGIGVYNVIFQDEPGAAGVGGGVGVIGEGLFGLQGIGEGGAEQTSSWGVSGLLSGSNGAAYSAQGKSFAATSSAGVWGDDVDGSGAGSGVLATADSNTALMAVNNSAYPTMEVTNNTSGTHDPVFETYSPKAYPSSPRNCVIDTSANLECSGLVEGSVTPDIDGTVRAMYAMQSPEVWFEDFGSGALTNGSAHVSLEPIFGGTVNSGVEYHVFLTPKGDCEGLYVANEGPEGFDVRELRHGTSSVAFDYRVVAKRKGYETMRMEDQTAQAEVRKTRMEDRARRMAEAAAHPTAAPPRRLQRIRPPARPFSAPQMLGPHASAAAPAAHLASEAP